MASIDDLVRRGGSVSIPGGAPAVRPPPVPTEGLRTYSPDQMSQLGGPKQPLSIGGPSPVPALQAPLYTPPGAAQLGAGQAATGIGGPGAQLPARQAPLYTPDQAPRLGGSPAAAGIGALPASAAPASAAGPLARAASLAGTIGKGIGVGAVADMALRAADPNDSIGTWVDKNVPGASWVDNAASKIGIGRSYAEQGIPQPGKQAIGSIVPPAAAATASQSGAAPAPGQASQQAIAAPSPGYTDELHRIQGQASAEQPAQAIASTSAPADAAQPPAAAPPDSPIRFITYGGAQGPDGTNGALVTNKDGTQTQLDTSKPLPPDVAAFNAQSQQAGQQDEPVQIIRGLDQTTALPSPGGGYREAPKDIADAGLAPKFFAAQDKNTLNAADPLGAQTASKIAESMGGFAAGAGAAPGTPGAQGAPAPSGNDYLATLPNGIATQVKKIASGEMAFPTGPALKMPYWQNMISAVSQYDPSFDAVNYNARAATRKAFTSGKESQQLNAMNTVAGHLESLSNAADALNNTSIPAVNSVSNWIASNTGDPRVKQFDVTKKAVVDELTRVWRGSGGSEGDIKAWADTLGASNSPEQLHGVIGQLGDLVESKINAMGEQYKQGMGSAAGNIRLVTPKSQAVFDKIKARAGGQPVAAPTAAPASAAPMPRKSIGGKTYENDGRGWYEVQ